LSISELGHLVKGYDELASEIERLREEFELKYQRKPTADELHMLKLAEQLLRGQVARMAGQPE
jgi:hypothetical protein